MENQACGFCRNPLLIQSNFGNKEANAQFQHTFPKLWRAKEVPNTWKENPFLQCPRKIGQKLRAALKFFLWGFVFNLWN